MQSWGGAYRRLRKQRRFANWFGQNGRIPGPNDFTARAFVLVFNNVTGTTPAEVGPPVPGAIFGPLTQIFPKGAVILGITSGAYMQQVPSGGGVWLDFVPPSINPGRRDCYNLFFQHTDGEKVTVDQPIFAATGATLNNLAEVNAEPLMGEGQKDEFPRELLAPPSTGFIVNAQSNLPGPTTGSPDFYPPLFIHVVFHVVVPKGG